MSRYPLKYLSASKGAVEIEDMPTPHLANAWRKLGGPTVAPGEAVSGADVVVFMYQELRARGCTLDAETGQWTFPPKPGDDIDKEAT